MRDIVLLGIVLLLGVTALRRPFVGLVTFIGLGLLNPHSMVWGFGRTFPFAQVIAGATLCGWMMSGERKRVAWSRESGLLLVLWAVYGWSTLSAVEPAAAFEQFTHVSKILLIVFVSMALVDTEVRLLWLCRVIGYSLGLYGVKAGLWFLADGGHNIVWGPEESFLHANNAIGLAFVMNVPILDFLIGVEKDRRLRWAARAMLGLSYVAAIGTFSRGAWVGLAVVTGLIALKRRRRVLWIACSLGMVVLLPMIASDTLLKRYDSLVNYGSESSAQSRFWNWELCRRVGVANPVTGAGFNFYSRRIYQEYYPEFLERWTGKVWSCHSAWMTVLAEHGVVGFLLWAGLFVSCLLSLRSMARTLRSGRDSPWLLGCVSALQVAFLGFAVVGTFLDSAYFDLYYQLIGVVVIMKGLVEGRVEARAAASTPLERGLRGEEGGRLSGRASFGDGRHGGAGWAPGAMQERGTV